MSVMKKLLFISFLLFSVQLFAQNNLIGDEELAAISLPKKGFKVRATIIGNDTMPVCYLQEVWIVDNRVYHSKAEEQKNKKLVRDVKKAYPYAQLAGQKLKQYELLLSGVKTDVEKKRLMKKVEKELKDEYSDELKKLTITQGRILLKLIDRETGNTSYELVKEMRGTFSAFFWQSLAKLFGSDLKSEYDPEKDDKKIEEIVKQIQKGYI